MKATKYPGIYLREDGRLLVRVTRQVDGKRRSAKRLMPEGASLKQAIEVSLELAEFAPRGTALTLTDYAGRWLRGKVVRLKPSTSERYLCALEQWILPRLGDIRVDALRRPDLADWVTWAERRRKADGTLYAGETLSGVWRVLIQFVGDAVADLELDIDPTSRLPGPRRRGGKRRELRTLTALELAEFLERVRVGWPSYYVEILALAHTGLRAGELYALRWSDVDLERGVLTVSRSVWHGRVGETKTGEPRVVPLSSVLAAELKPLRGIGLVFPSSDGGFRSYTVLAKPMTACSVGLRVTPQVLRRTFNTLCLAEGVDRAVLRSMMGHTSEEMTQRYSGIGDDLKLAAVGRLFGR